MRTIFSPFFACTLWERDSRGGLKDTRAPMAIIFKGCRLTLFFLSGGGYRSHGAPAGPAAISPPQVSASSFASGRSWTSARAGGPMPSVPFRSRTPRRRDIFCPRNFGLRLDETRTAAQTAPFLVCSVCVLCAFFSRARVPKISWVPKIACLTKPIGVKLAKLWVRQFVGTHAEEIMKPKKTQKYTKT